MATTVHPARLRLVAVAYWVTHLTAAPAIFLDGYVLHRNGAPRSGHWESIALLLLLIAFRCVALARVSAIAAQLRFRLQRAFLLYELPACASVFVGLRQGFNLWAFFSTLTVPFWLLYVIPIAAGIVTLIGMRALTARPESRDSRNSETSADLFRPFMAALTIITPSFVIALLNNPIPTDVIQYGQIQSSLLNWPMVVLCSHAALGLILAVFQPHVQRSLAALPVCALAVALALLSMLVSPESRWPYYVLGIAIGWSATPLAIACCSSGDIVRRFSRLLLTHLLPLLCSAVIALLFRQREYSATNVTSVFLVLTLLGAAVVTRLYLRELIEQIIEFLIWPTYRVRAYGPGQYQIPLTGPAIVISNHAAWLDPIWLAKALPCRLTPMMTSRFFDLPFVGWVVRVLAKAIRVPDTGFRRETPEIQQAIERLREGHVVLVFPEGRMRRNEKQPLRRFGQGIYHILRDQPGIPVISCWIDGNWGSFTSFSGGPPTKNKKMDLWRPINIGVSEPIIVPTDILADANLTRRYMMQACLGARARLGLEVPEVTSFADREEDDEPGTG